MLRCATRMDEIYAKHTGGASSRCATDMERDRFFTAEQAVEYGLADRIIETHQLTRKTRRLQRELAGDPEAERDGLARRCADEIACSL